MEALCSSIFKTVICVIYFEEFVLKNTGFKKSWGTFSDISILAPKAKIAAVNLSSGYYKAHTVEEYVNFADMTNTIEVAKKLITAECTEPFEYIEGKSYNWYDDYNGIYTYKENYYKNTTKSYNKNKNSFDLEFELELEVLYLDKHEKENVGYANGSTKAECWAMFFLEFSDVCFDDVVDYSFV